MINLLRVPLGKTEPLPSYASRLAAANGSPTLRQFLIDMDIEESGIVHGKSASLQKTATLGHVDSKELRTFSFCRGESGIMVNGQDLTRLVLRRQRLRVCLSCLQEDIELGYGPLQARPYCRVAWLLKPIYCCPRHNVMLHEVSDAPVAFAAYDFSTRISSLLPDLRTMIGSSQMDIPTPFETYVINRIHGQSTGNCWPDRLPFYAAIRVVEILGAVSEFGVDVTLEELDDADWRRAGAAGFDIAKHGKASIDPLLARFRKNFFRRQREWGPRATYGRLYDWLAHESEDLAYDPLRDIIWDYAVENFPIGSDDELFGRRLEHRLIHSVHSASLETGLHPKRLRKLLSEAGLISKQDADLTNDRLLFSAKAAAPVLASLTGSLKFKEIGAYLNIPRAQLLAFDRAGLFEPYMSFETNHGKARAFSRQALDQFMATLLYGAKPAKAASARRLTVPAAAKKACCMSVEILRLALDGKLAWKGRLNSTRGYMSLLVDVEEIRSLVRGEDHGGVTLRQAEKKLGVSTAVLTALIAHGYIPAQEVLNPVNRCPQRVIQQADIDAFNATYIGLQALGAERHAYLGALKKELTAMGINPALPPEHVRATFYNRPEIEQLKVYRLSRTGN